LFILVCTKVFGLPVLEALACDTPVVTSDNSSLSEIFGGYVILVNPNNVSEIASAMKEVLSGKIDVVKINLENFDWNNTANVFKKIIYENRN